VFVAPQPALAKATTSSAAPLKEQKQVTVPSAASAVSSIVPRGTTANVPAPLSSPLPEHMSLSVLAAQHMAQAAAVVAGAAIEARRRRLRRHASKQGRDAAMLNPRSTVVAMAAFEDGRQRLRKLRADVSKITAEDSETGNEPSVSPSSAAVRILPGREASSEASERHALGLAALYGQEVLDFARVLERSEARRLRRLEQRAAALSETGDVITSTATAAGKKKLTNRQQQQQTQQLAKSVVAKATDFTVNRRRELAVTRWRLLDARMLRRAFCAGCGSAKSARKCVTATVKSVRRDETPAVPLTKTQRRRLRRRTLQRCDSEPKTISVRRDSKPDPAVPQVTSKLAKTKRQSHAAKAGKQRCSPWCVRRQLLSRSRMTSPRAATASQHIQLLSDTVATLPQRIRSRSTRALPVPLKCPDSDR
jgi:hypothetical protein